MTLPVTLSGGVLFASWKLFQFPSSLIVKVILAIFTGASAQQLQRFNLFRTEAAIRGLPGMVWRNVASTNKLKTSVAFHSIPFDPLHRRARCITQQPFACGQMVPWKGRINVTSWIYDGVQCAPNNGLNAHGIIGMSQHIRKVAY